MSRKSIGALASGLLYGLSFPPFNLHFLAWFAFVPLLLCLSHVEPPPTRVAFSRGFFALFISYLLIFWWLWPTFKVAEIHPVTTFLCWILLSAVVALYGGAFTLFWTRIPWVWARPWLGAAAWVALDEVRSVILTGFPWALASHTQARFPAVIQLASVTGAAGITFLVILANGALAQAIAVRTKASIRSLVVAMLFITASVVGGQWRLSQSGATTERRMLVSVLQGNIDQYRKWDDAYEADVRNTYARLITELRKTVTPDVIVWPETSVPGWIPRDPVYVQWITGVVKASGVANLFGALSSDNNGDYNAALLMTAEGVLTDRYFKKHLVPFGEYVPVVGFLKSVIPYLGQVGTFNAGRERALFHVNGFSLAPNICYEAMFPALVRTSAVGADVIVNITNDGWFLRSAAPEQHFVTNIYRAVENGRPVVRAANTGISGYVDRVGRVQEESGLLHLGAYTYSVSLGESAYRTIFSRWGNWFGWLCFLTSAISGVVVFRRRFV